MKKTKVDEVRKGIKDVHSEKQEEEVDLTLTSLALLPHDSLTGFWFPNRVSSTWEEAASVRYRREYDLLLEDLELVPRL